MAKEKFEHSLNSLDKLGQFKDKFSEGKKMATDQELAVEKKFPERSLGAAATGEEKKEDVKIPEISVKDKEREEGLKKLEENKNQRIKKEKDMEKAADIASKEIEKQTTVFSPKKEDKKLDAKYVPNYITKEINRLGKNLVSDNKTADEAKYFREELEKAKAVRDKIKAEKIREVGIKELKKNRVEEQKIITPRTTPVEYEKTDEEIEEEIKKIKEESLPEAEIIGEIDLEKRDWGDLFESLDKQSKVINVEIEKKNPWVREKIEKAASWYKKQPLWKKVLFSAGCLGAASASAVVGGAVGATIATAAFTGSFGQRMLGGIATFVTAEGLLKKAAEKGGKERTKAEVIRHTVEAATLGILTGSGLTAKAVREISEATGVTDILRESYRYWFPSNIQPSEIVSHKLGVGEAPPQSGVPIVSEQEIIKVETLPIGERGPEGAIINYFKNNPDIAKKFGWDGNVDVNKWAGIKARQLWLEDAKEALAKPETLDQLQKLGYPANAEGYGQMMHRIGEGGVEINPETGKIELVDTEYLKAKIVEPAIEIKPPISEKIPLETSVKEDLDNFTEKQLEIEVRESEARLAGEQKEVNIENIARAEKFAVLTDKAEMLYLDKIANETGLTPGEYGVIKDIKVKDYLDEILEYKKSGEFPKLPHEGIYGAFELNHQVKLAEILNDADPNLTVEQALQSKAVGGSIINNVTEAPIIEEMTPATSAKEDLDNFTEKQLEIEVRESAARLVGEQKEADIILKEQIDITENQMNLRDKINQTEKLMEERIAEKAPSVKEIFEEKNGVVNLPKEQTLTVETANVSLLPEKAEILNNLIFEDTFSGSKAEKLFDLIKRNKITSKDFADYYADKVNASSASLAEINNMKNTFKIITEEGHSGPEILKAKTTLRRLIEIIGATEKKIYDTVREPVEGVKNPVPYATEKTFWKWILGK